jgi:hypothetical protein
LSTLLTLSLCRSYRDPTPSLFSKEVKSKQSISCCVILRYGTWFRSSSSKSLFASLNSKILSAPFAPKHVAFYFVVYACMQQFW